MSYTKRQLVESALAELGLANYSFDLMPEQLEQALYRLNSMMAEWNARGLRLAYSVPASPEDSDIDEGSGVPDSAWEAIITNLAVRMAPSYGKVVSVDTKTTARHALNTLMSRAAMPAEMQMPSMPAGAGNKQIDNPFTSVPSDELTAGPDGNLEFN